MKNTTTYFVTVSEFERDTIAFCKTYAQPGPASDVVRLAKRIAQPGRIVSVTKRLGKRVKVLCVL